MATYDTIRKDLKRQQKIEGYTPETALLLKVLPMATTSSEWQALVTIGEHRYGKLSYECHRFYYPSNLLTKLMEMS